MIDELMLAVEYEPLYTDAKVPQRATKGSAGYDLFTHINGRRIRVYDAHNKEMEVQCYDAKDIGLPPENQGVVLLPGERALIPTGLKIQLPQGFFGGIYIRGGTGVKRGLRMANGVGVVDEDYADEWFIPVQNVSEERVHILHGERIAQLVIQPYWTFPWEEARVLPSTERAGGFNSTGTR